MNRRAYSMHPDVAGGLGSQSELVTTVHPPEVRRLHYDFAGWLGDDIVESFPCFIVTTPLAQALTEARLSGFELDEVLVTKDPQFELALPDVASELPTWKWLRVTGTAWVDDIWQDDAAVLHVSERALGVFRGFILDHCTIEEVAESA